MARNSRLNAAAAAVGAALGRFVAEAQTWTHARERQSAIDVVSATLEEHRRLLDQPPVEGRIGAISEVAHQSDSARPKKPAPRSRKRSARPVSTNRRARRSGRR